MSSAQASSLPVSTSMRGPRTKALGRFTVETVWFSRPHASTSVWFESSATCRGVLRPFLLTCRAEPESGLAVSPVPIYRNAGQPWGDRVAAGWEATVLASLTAASKRRERRTPCPPDFAPQVQSSFRCSAPRRREGQPRTPEWSTPTATSRAGGFENRSGSPAIQQANITIAVRPHDRTTSWAAWPRPAASVSSEVRAPRAVSRSREAWPRPAASRWPGVWLQPAVSRSPVAPSPARASVSWLASFSSRRGPSEVRGHPGVR